MGAQIGNQAFKACDKLSTLVIQQGVTLEQEAFAGWDGLRLALIPDDFSTDVFPAEVWTVTHTDYRDFLNDEDDFQEIESEHVDVVIMQQHLRFCYFLKLLFASDLQHLEVYSTYSMHILLSGIQKNYEKSGNDERSKQLLAFFMGARFVRACGDKDVVDMIASARCQEGGGDSVVISNLQKLLNAQDWQSMHALSRNVSRNPSAFFQRTVLGGLGAAEPNAAGPTVGNR